MGELALMRILVLLSLCAVASASLAGSLESQLRQFANSPHLELVTEQQKEVEDHLLGLGAMKKVRGAWGLKASARVTGSLMSYTWRVVDGFGSEEVLAELQAALLPQLQDGAEGKGATSHIGSADKPLDTVETLYACDGRACGHGAQWASRVFGQRILYGRGDAQRYRIYGLESGAYRLVLYASVRSSDRQYVHVELIRLAMPESKEQTP